MRRKRWSIGGQSSADRRPPGGVVENVEVEATREVCAELGLRGILQGPRSDKGREAEQAATGTRGAQS